MGGKEKEPASFHALIVFDFVMFCGLVVGNCLSVAVAQLRCAFVRFSSDITIFFCERTDNFVYLGLLCFFFSICLQFAHFRILSPFLSKLKC